jgi:hypothetical protein
MSAGAKFLEDEGRNVRPFGIRDDVSEVVVIDVAERPRPRPLATEKFLFAATGDVTDEAYEIIGCATSLYRHEKTGIIGVEGTGRSANAGDDSALEHPTDLAFVYRISVEAVDVPGENASGFATLNAREHGIEDGTPRCLSRSALFQVFQDEQILTLR